MKTFTRRELIHTAIEIIRVLYRLYGKTGELQYINCAREYANFLMHLEIINANKWLLLCNIIRAEEKRKSCAKWQQDDTKTN